MTISLNTPRNTYTATAGQTDFTIGFEFFAVADVKAYKNGTLLTYNASPSTNSQYSLVGTASSSDDAYEFGGGGTLKLGGGGASANDIIVIIRDIAITRTSDFSSTGTLDVKSINTQLDQLTAIVGDLKGQTDRSVKLLDTDTVSATVTLPAKATRQSKILGFDANGNIETTVSSSGLATLSSITSDITTVAGISSDITAVAADATDIGVVAAANTNIGTIASNISNINSVAGVSSLITSDFVSDLNTLATTAIVEDLNILATTDIVNDLNQLATTDFVSDLNAIEGIKANVTTVANNVTGVNSFAERYRVGSSDPTSSLDEGDLFYNSTDNAVKFYNGTSWASITAGLTDIVNDGTPQLGGDLDVNGNSIVSASNGNIAITPNGSGKIILDGLSFPTADGTSGQALTTDGAGNVAFTTIQASELSTQGAVFSNYNAITSSVTTTVASSKNAFLFGPITVSGSATWTVSGSGTLEIL
tara:strand:- start:1344 stop:2774 length:1431 start_codon:yes stop_codon:yes gene_type:complete